MNLVQILLVNDFTVIDEYSGELQIRLLRYFSEHSFWAVRVEVAKHPNATIDILHKLSDDEDYYVRSRVAANPNTPADILRQMCAEDDVEIIEAAKVQLERRGL